MGWCTFISSLPPPPPAISLARHQKDWVFCLKGPPQCDNKMKLNTQTVSPVVTVRSEERLSSAPRPFDPSTFQSQTSSPYCGYFHGLGRGSDPRLTHVSIGLQVFRIWSFPCNQHTWEGQPLGKVSSALTSKDGFVLTKQSLKLPLGEDATQMKPGI